MMSVSLIERTSASELHPFKYGVLSGTCDIEKWCKLNGTLSAVRMTPFEFDFAFAINRSVMIHYNLQHSAFLPNGLYAGVEIFKSGYYNGTTDIKPTLILDRWILLRCLSSRNHVAYSDLTNNDFLENDMGAVDAASLMVGMWKKYSSSLPGLPRSELESLGLAVTQFQIAIHHTESNMSDLTAPF